MAGLPVRDPAVDRSLRSVFVGNIPYEATEEQLKDIFSEVGPVVSFRLVYDRETGKPKGYGFCEYQDQETALSAMRNLNGREFSGRALRVDNAASEKNKEELKSLGTGAPVIESPYGETISPEDAPESISKAVASLPPEQMFELMKQMKLCVQNSPQEARNMLLQNPQLAYALLQAQVVMRIVDPEIALKILHRQTNIPTLISGNPQPVHVAGPGSGPNVSMNQQNPQAPQAQSLGGMHVNGAPLMQASMPGGVPAPVQMTAAVAGPGPGSLAPAAYLAPLEKTELLLCGRDQSRICGVMQAQVGMQAGGPVPMERGQGTLQHSPVGPAGPASIERVQVPMQDPRAAMQRGALPANVPTPRGLLGDAPNDPRGGTLMTVTGEVEPRAYLGPPPPPHQGPPMHHVPGHEGRGPPPHDMRGGPLAEPRPLMAEPRGPMLDQRVPPMDARGGRDPRGLDARGLEARAMEARGLDARGLEARAMEARAMEARAMEARAMEARAMEARAMEARGMDTRGPVPGPRGPMPSGIQGPNPMNMGAVVPQGTRQVPVMQGAAMQGATMPAGSQPGGFSPGQSQVTPQDHEKAALIMQVLQLTADQIAMLPPEQRQSILILKEQIQKSTGAP
ncbi:cleavage stimulation factor subunit 2 isoform X1 [Peromyscus maniculatus bairdii]|uniref:cleavage stimulation factor subunit 2 isoform X1 n=2 Tax=Peromyscus maniculatus bairdii TaxID=230844 RepID=UPI00077DAC7C|nr:cleavage stimulation factor subunit 2 isoform X1 [Peromyscus maniculatus bairdii]